MKLIIDIPDNEYEYTCERTLSDRTFWDDAIRKGIPLDDVIGKIDQLPLVLLAGNWHIDKDDVMQILDRIGKESEDT